MEGIPGETLDSSQTGWRGSSSLFTMYLQKWGEPRLKVQCPPTVPHRAHFLQGAFSEEELARLSGQQVATLNPTTHWQIHNISGVRTETWTCPTVAFSKYPGFQEKKAWGCPGLIQRLNTGHIVVSLEVVCASACNLAPLYVGTSDGLCTYLVEPEAW